MMSYCKGDKDWDLVNFIKGNGDKSDYPFPIGNEKTREITVCGKKYTSRATWGYEFHVLSNGVIARGFPVKPYKLQRRGKKASWMGEKTNEFEAEVEFAYLVDSIGRVWIYHESNDIFESPCFKVCDHYVCVHDPDNYDHFKVVQRENALNVDV